MSKVIIQIKRGVIYSVHTDLSTLEVVVLDHDTNRESRQAEESQTIVQNEKILQKIIADFLD